jgi:hypothetical protein
MRQVTCRLRGEAHRNATSKLSWFAQELLIVAAPSCARHIPLTRETSNVYEDQWPDRSP